MAARPDDHELSTALRHAGSPEWSVRAAAGRRLAGAERIEDLADVLHGLLLDGRDTAVVQETATALLERGDTAGLRCVLRARHLVEADDVADELGAALGGDPQWLTTEGADRLVARLHELAADPDPGVGDEAHRILARLRPREQWAT
ncbi:hypothetical protein [Streptomyces sp. TLI_171]|uniref:hypothetical protein n=1 Tax=Streptomyces sp. TLI_171 TaxID=1938859 RepID=UPI000C175F57|nr:hypothetical protein [Streptomyces sp. TLI_171]RKE22474.1 hypothetical protein BX266_5918 [Streptomyces sp. TLI_171]